MHLGVFLASSFLMCSIAWMSSSVEVISQTSDIRYYVTDLGTLGGNNSAANGINNMGQVVGNADIKGNAFVHAFRYTMGSMEDIGLGWKDQSSYANAINDSGYIVGYWGRGGANHGFVYSNDGIEYPCGIKNYSSCMAVNSKGNAVGFFGTDESSPMRAFTYIGGSFKDIGTLGGGSSSAVSINDFDQVVGTSQMKGDAIWHPFLYSNGVMKDIVGLGDSYSEASGINNKGWIIGNSSIKINSKFAIHAYLYADGTVKDLDPLGKRTSYALGINQIGQIVGRMGGGAVLSDFRAFLYEGGIMKDLNEKIDHNSGWTLLTANSINDKGQIVGIGTKGDIYGPAHAFMLGPISTGLLEAVQKQPDMAVLGTLPEKEAGKDSLIIITHGRIPKGDNPVKSTAWVDSMSDSIKIYLVAHKISNWQVYGYKWFEGAQASILDVLENAKQTGVHVGRQILAQGYTHVHFIAHSAGSGLIQSATDVIKMSNTDVIIQETFLDPYVGPLFEGTTWFGSRANWADNYSTQDHDTRDEYVPFTYNILTHAYNVDVTQLDIDGRRRLSYWVTGSGTPCYVTESTHTWPIEFYSNSIVGAVTSEYEGFGFGLSKVGGNWNYALNNYTVGNGSLGHILGIPDATGCRFELPAPSYTKFITDFLKNPSIQSDTGTINAYPKGSLKLATGSPAWFAQFVTISDTANLVSFDAVFQSSAGSEGLLSVYWDENIIGSIDERVVQPGLQNYSFKFPNATSNSVHMLGFRLDPFANVQSVVVLTNALLTFKGLSQTYSLAITGTINGLPVYQLNGQSGLEYHIQASTNLIDWTPIAVLANTNGKVQFFDADSTNYMRRFYRAINPF